ncbi:asparagine synthase (glutamine-hydrolyzing) [Polaribacter aestuariivivens]|uniref:asparagine synthase (glutamine-hydrolyzing) n=1 Tax=Polaribacter aestuariivivens TaxID=2304626 RepID=UPI003F498DC0
MPFKKEEVVAKLKKIEFRGPDNLGHKKVNSVSIAHLRLSILDIDARSNQPMTFKNLHITFNGEIFNFKEIRQELQDVGYKFETTSDTEVLLIGYHHWNKEIVNKLNGMFAFVIFDENTNKVFCARDRLGQKPFYYYWKNGNFEICSQLQPLINKNSIINEDAVSIYLDCGYVPSPHSILQDIYKLEPGKYMEVDLNTNEKTINTYWDLSKIKTKKITYSKAKEELHSLLTDAVKIRLQSDVPLGSFLSGGVDSALVTAIAAQCAPEKIKTFTIGFNDPKYDESKVAEKFAEILNTNHTTTTLNPKMVLNLIPKLIEVYDEPFADSSALPSLLLNKTTKQHVTVALSGDGGDESFLGYLHFDVMNKYQKIAKILPFPLRKLLAKLPWYKIFKGRPETIKGILNSKNVNSFIKSNFTGFDSVQKNRKTSWLNHYHKSLSLAKNAIQRMADFNIKLWLENDSNVKVDRASMAYSVEVRSPFLDYRVVEYARTLPVSYRYQKGNKKRITKDILQQYIPKEVYEQPKKGFSIPMAKWIREDLREEFTQVLNDKFLNSVPNLDVKKFKKRFNEHLNNKYDYSYNIWRLYILGLWNKDFESIKSNE